MIALCETRNSAEQDRLRDKKENQPANPLPQEESSSANAGAIRDEFEYQRKLFFGK